MCASIQKEAFQALALILDGVSNDRFGFKMVGTGLISNTYTQ